MKEAASNLLPDFAGWCGFCVVFGGLEVGFGDGLIEGEAE